MITPENIDSFWFHLAPDGTRRCTALLELQAEGRTEEEARQALWDQIYPEELRHAAGSLEALCHYAKTRALTPLEARAAEDHGKLIDAYLHPKFS
jgi:hypothetical protein